MKIGLRLMLVVAIIGGCAKKTETEQKKEMAKEPVAKRAAQKPIAPRVVEEKPVELEAPYAALVNYDFAKSRAPLSAIEDDIRKGAAGYRQIEARLIAVLKNPQTTVPGKQAACRLLERVGGDASVPVLAGMLEDQQLSFMARFALERMPSARAAAALRDELNKAKGPVLLGIISSVGQKRDEQAVEKLKSLAMESDPPVARAAVEALGRIGMPSAAKALQELQGKAPQPLAPVVAEARITCARQMPRGEAVEIYKALTDGKYPQPVRVAALAGWISASNQPEKVKLILLTLEGDDEEMHAAALGNLTPNTTPEIRNAVAAAIPDLKPEAQLRLLAVFSDQRGTNLRPSLLKIIGSGGDAAVRAAAIEALITHGTAEDVPALLEIATKNGADAAAARRTLQQMGAKGTDQALIELADRSEKDAKVLIIRTLAVRNSRESVPMLLKLVTGGDAALAGEASSALGVVGGVEHLPPLTEIVLSAEQDNVRGAAEGAIKAICARTQDKEVCANVILPSLIRAKTPAARIGLIRTLSRLPIDKSLAAVMEAIKDPDEKVRDAAVRELADWPSIAAAEPLLQLAHGDNQTHAVLALRGYIRLAGLKDRPAAERLAMYRKALETAKRNEEKKAALAGLADVPSIDALTILQHYLPDEQLKADAASAIVRLAKVQGASQNAKMMVVLSDLRGQAGLESMRGQIDDGIKTLEDIRERTQGFIVAWMTAGPYTQAGKNGGALFDVAFGPEKDEKVDWEPLIRPADAADLWMIDLHKVISPGNERVAYLKTNINSAREQKAMLEIGSDDGVKVWVNGKLVHANNAARPVKQGEDKVKIDLKQGSNVVLMKITQGGGDWACCARLVGTDGKKINDVQVNAE
ncbi:MAG TPA: HEAT repeat domain-containing protein [Tepidisphaeraceae bacterium]|jgi:HEAT repeat protein|nr:HEAT repeat domain-containing protein [Tepidisphaeraceae bacterium]